MLGSTIHGSAAPTLRPQALVYRRSTTRSAPRKRSFLVKLQCAGRSAPPRSMADLGRGGGGANGDGGVPPGAFRKCCGGGGDGNDGGAAGSSSNKTSLLAAVALGGAALLAAAAPSAAAAAGTTHLLGGEPHDLAAALLFSGLGSSGGEDEDLTPTGVGFTEEERELVVPKQYRVREWVYVH